MTVPNMEQFYLHNKIEATDLIQERMAQIKCHYGKAPKWIHFNNGMESINKTVKSWAQKRITIETTAPHSPSQHGVAEHFNCQIGRCNADCQKFTNFFLGRGCGKCNISIELSANMGIKYMRPYKTWN